jgi:hypothetical protein
MDTFDFFKKSTKLKASFPRVPTPYLDGREVICNKTPAHLFCSIENPPNEFYSFSVYDFLNLFTSKKDQV